MVFSVLSICIWLLCVVLELIVFLFFISPLYSVAKDDDGLPRTTTGCGC